jgi:hypothetical protein
METVNGKSPIWVGTKNTQQFGYLKKLIEEESDNFSTLEFEITKHEGAVVKIVHTTKFKVRSEKCFDTKS